MRSFFTRMAKGFFGTAMLMQVDELRRYIAAAPSLPIDQDRAEVRIQAAFITMVFLLLLVEPIFYLYAVPDALISRVSALAPSKWCVVGAFGLALLGALPHLWTLLWRPDLLQVQRYRVWAALSALLASIDWIVLANLAVPLDVGGLEWAYCIRALVTLCIAGIYGFSVNAQQMREHLNAEDA